MEGVGVRFWGWGKKIFLLINWKKVLQKSKTFVYLLCRRFDGNGYPPIRVLIFWVMGFTFLSSSSERLALSFKSEVSGKNLSDKDLYRYAKIFFYNCLSKGNEDCLFPEYLVEFAKQENAMERLIRISYLIEGNKDASSYSDIDLRNAKIMFEYVKKHSGNFTCTNKYLYTLWQAAYFKIFGYEG